MILGEGEGRLISDDMLGDDPVGRPVKTAIPLVMRGVSEEDTQGGASLWGVEAEKLG